MSKARDLADLGGVTTRLDQVGNSDGALSNRNMVINGSMVVAQRGNVAVTPSAVVYGGADRWRMYPNISGTASSTVAQTAVIWTESKFAQGLTATTASAAGSMLFMQRIEAVNTSHIAGNKVTLQFKIAHDVGSTLTVQIVLQRPTNTADDYSPTTDITGVTTVGTCPTGTSSGTLFTYTSDTLTSTDVSKGLQIQIRVVTTAAVTNKNFYLGDVQLELGDTATPFEHISFGDQLQKCMRYFQKSYNINTAPGTAGTTGAISNRYGGTSVTNRPVSVRYTTIMRSIPSVTFYSKSGTSGNVSDMGTTYTTGTDVSASVSSDNVSGFSDISLGTGKDAMISFHYTADAEL